MKVLAVDIGGSHVKALVSGNRHPIRFESGKHLTPSPLLEGLRANSPAAGFDVVAMGYPGPVGPDGPTAEATVEPHEHAVLEAIHELGLEWHVIFNKGAVTVLPSTVTKATGLAAALDELSLRAGQTIGVGDAENDQAFLRACGLAVSVANGLSSLKSCADLVTEAENGQGVIELAGRLLAGTLSREPGPLADDHKSGHRP